jgi:hypothetical protein
MKPPPTDPPRKPSAGDGEPPERVSARQVRESESSPGDAGPSDEPPARQVPSPRRPSGHQSYRLGEPTTITPATAHAASDVSKYDDGVPHRHHAPGEHDLLHNEDVGHEHIDVDIRGLIASAVVLVVITLFAQAAMYFMFGWMESSAAARDVETSPVARPATNMPPTTQSPYFSQSVGGPQLLTNEPMALEKHTAEVNERLHGFGWVDQNAGTARISIEQAKKLIVERGLPARADSTVPATLGTRLPAAGEGSGGRAITVPLPEPPSSAPAQKPAEKPHGGQH